MMKHESAYRISQTLFRSAVVILAICALVILPGTTKRAFAACLCGSMLTCSNSDCLHKETRKQVNEFVDKEFENHQKWLEETWWEEVLKSLRAMTEQINAGQQQVVAADSQVQTANMSRNNALTIKEGEFEITKETTPSEGLCSAVTATENVVTAEIARAETTDRFVQAAASNFNASAGSPSAPGREAILNQEAFIQCLPQYRADYPDADCSNATVYPTAAAALLDGRVSADSETDAAQSLNQFMGSFTVPPPVGYTPDNFNRAAQLAWANRRALSAPASLAARCYMKAVSGNTVLEGTDWTDEQKAAMREMGMDDQAIAAFPFNAQNHREFLSMVNNSTQRALDMIETQENTQRIALVTQGSNLPILYDMLEQQLCSEMMASLVLNAVTEPLKEAAEEKATQVTLRTDEEAAKTKYASSH